MTAEASQLDAFGATFGIEEEYHLIDPRTYALRSSPALTRRTKERVAESSLRPEMLTSQLEAVTAVCTTLEQGRAELVAMRVEATAAAADVGATILATSTHPTATLEEIDIAPFERYQRMLTRFGSVVRAFNLCGCHVHASVPDLDSAVAVMTHARPYLPLLNALTGSSPFHEGADTGYQSFRIAWVSLWHQGGTPPHLDTAEEYLATIEQMVALGLVEGPDQVLWEMRPSARYPTLEFRVADVCTDLDDALLFAGLVRALVRTLGARVLAGERAPVLNEAVLRGARWRAARYGVTGELWDPAAGRLISAAAAVDALLTEISPALQYFGDEALVRELAARVLDRGTSAQRQRNCFATSGRWDDVLRDAVELTARS